MCYSQYVVAALRFCARNRLNRLSTAVTRGRTMRYEYYVCHENASDRGNLEEKRVSFRRHCDRSYDDGFTRQPTRESHEEQKKKIQTIENRIVKNTRRAIAAPAIRTLLVMRVNNFYSTVYKILYRRRTQTD